MRFLRGVIAEDVWSALDVAKTAEEKKKILTLNKHGIWDLKSNKEGTKGKTTLMYLASKGDLNSRTIVKTAPDKYWGVKDENGATYFDYLYKRWIQSSGKNEIDIRAPYIDISAEKYASLVWYGINYQKDSILKDCGIMDLVLVAPPEILKTGEDKERDRFWDAFFKNNNAIDTLFKAIISTEGFPFWVGKANQRKIATMYKEDFAIWRKSLQAAKMEDGKRWVESSKEIANIVVMLLFIEKITPLEPCGGKEVIGGLPKVAEVWSNKMSEAVADLYSIGGRIDSALQKKDKICLEHTKKIMKEVKPRDRSTVRRSYVEDFDSNVLSEVSKLDELLKHWRVFEERASLSLAVDNLKEDEKVIAQFVL